MASATFQLKAVDQTAQAFASVQNKLSKMHTTAKQVGVGMATFFGFGAVVGGVKRLDAYLEDAEKSAKKLGMSSEDLDKLTVATGYLDEKAMMAQNAVSLLAAELAGVFTGGDIAAKAFEIRMERGADALKLANEEAENLNQQLKNVGLGESKNAELDKKRAQQIRDNAEELKKTDPLKYQQEINKAKAIEISVAQSLFSLNENYLKSVESLGVAQSAIFGEQNSAQEKLVGLKGEEVNLMTLFAGTDIDDLTTRIRLNSELTENYQKQLPLIAEINQLSTDAGSLIAQGFEDAILSGQKLSDVMRALGQDLLRLVFQQTITGPLAKGITSALLGVPFMAMGGPVSSGSPYIVGERGPELFVPSSSGSIVPNSKMSSGGGGGMGGVTVNYNIAGGVSRAELVPILEQERRRLKAEIPDMVRRGGSYRSAFA
jgi:hypothetical protein